MKPVKCIVVDDEPLAIKIVEEYIRKTPFLELIAGCESPFEAMKIMQKQKTDLIFLDIQMPDLSGLDFSKSLRKDIKVVFTTAFQEYAIEGYKVNAVGYLLKPFSYAEFLEVVHKVKEVIDQEDSRENKTIEFKPFFIKSGYQTVRIEPEKILFFEGLKDYVKIYIEGQTSPIVTLMNMKSINDFLPSEIFVRIHRSYFINLHKVEIIEKGSVKIGGRTLPVSEGYREAFQEIIAKNLLSR